MNPARKGLFEQSAITNIYVSFRNFWLDQTHFALLRKSLHKYALSVFLNSFAVNFLTNLFSQCHIYFNGTRRNAMCSTRLLKIFIFLCLYSITFAKYPKYEIILCEQQNICKQSY